MKGSNIALLENIVDYPEEFFFVNGNTEEALNKYFQILDSLDGWILNRLVCTEKMLDYLTDYFSRSSEQSINEPLPLCYHVGSLNEFDESIKTVENFLSSTNRAQIDVLEFKADPGLLDAHLMARYAKICEKFENFRNETYIELEWDENLIDNLHIIADTELLCVKVKLAGKSSYSIPNSKKLASFIQECTNLDVRYKFSCGSSGIIYGQTEVENIQTHGIVNVLVAGLMTMVNDLTQSEIEQILTDSNKKNFVFEDTYLSWKDQDATIEDIEAFRTSLVSLSSSFASELIQEMHLFA